MGDALAGRTALITGAASGMGATTARLFADEGAHVVGADRLAPEGGALATQIVETGGQASFAALDVTDADNWDAVVAEVVARTGGLDILVNNAGISGAGAEDLFDLELWYSLVAVNSTGMFLGLRACRAALRASGRGAVVNVSSIAAAVGSPHVHVGYNASKGAVRAMTKGAAVVLADEGIRVNSVHPGVMPPMLGSASQPDSSVRSRSLNRVPMKRVGRTEEVAQATLFLVSDQASYITGAELYVDGGYLAM